MSINPTDRGGAAPAANEVEVGKVRHYFGKISVAIIYCGSDGLKIGDTIHVKGPTTDFTMKIESMQVEKQEVQVVEQGKTVAVRTTAKARNEDTVYKVKE